MKSFWVEMIIYDIFRTRVSVTVKITCSLSRDTGMFLKRFNVNSLLKKVFANGRPFCKYKY